MNCVAYLVRDKHLVACGKIQVKKMGDDNNVKNKRLCSTRNIPTLENGESYPTWKEDIRIWAAICGLDKNEQALHIHLSLSGRARTASSEIGMADLNKDDGVDTLIAKLDDLFLPEKERRQFLAFNNLYNLRRSDDISIKTFVADFEHYYYKFTQESMTLPDPVIAFMLLSACNLAESQAHLVMSALTKVSYAEMKAIIMRVFGSDVKHISPGNEGNIEVKTETALPVDNCDENALYTNNNWRGSNWRGRGRNARVRGTRGARGFNGGQNRGRWTGAAASGTRGSMNRRSNPVDNSGEISRCRICESKFHWAADCPHSYERLQKDEESNDESVQIAMFIGFAEGMTGDKLGSLVTNAKDCALLDTGCSKTVCGVEWLNHYMNSLTKYQRDKVKQEKSVSKFTFGDGRSFQSEKRVTLPCIVGGMSVEITTDVVECQIPLLLSSKSLSRAKATWSFMDNVLTIAGKKIKLQQTKSGHNLLPLSQ